MNEKIKVYHGDCLEILPCIGAETVDSVVTDPPYGLSFMNNKWDYEIPSVEIWKETYRVMKPGAYLLAFSGTRTYHRMAVNIEDAGFEIKDQIGWIYSSGFPKSQNLKQRKGWGTGLKPAWESIVMAKKPTKISLKENLEKFSTGAINIDGCRVPIDPELDASQLRVMNRSQRTLDKNGQSWGMSKNQSDTPQVVREDGRFPSNIIHDGSDEVLEIFNGKDRFFYCAKASKKERGDIEHPTLKPLELMKYLCRLVTPANGIILDPFAGSGTTGIAATTENFQSILIEKDIGFYNTILNRIADTITK